MMGFKEEETRESARCFEDYYSFDQEFLLIRASRLFLVSDL